MWIDKEKPICHLCSYHPAVVYDKLAYWCKYCYISIIIKGDKKYEHEFKTESERKS